MAAKGSVAKESLIKRFITAVGNDYVGEDNKKYYFNSKENGEIVQVCVSLTVPKTPLNTKTLNEDINFEEDDIGAVPTESKNPMAMMGDEEKELLDRLMKELDL